MHDSFLLLLTFQPERRRFFSGMANTEHEKFETNLEHRNVKEVYLIDTESIMNLN